MGSQEVASGINGQVGLVIVKSYTSLCRSRPVLIAEEVPSHCCKDPSPAR